MRRKKVKAEVDVNNALLESFASKDRAFLKNGIHRSQRK